MNVWGKHFKLPQLTHENFLTIDDSCKILYVTYSTTHQRSVEVQFGRYQKNILQESCRVKKLSCVSCGSLKRFPHTFTSVSLLIIAGRLWTEKRDYEFSPHSCVSPFRIKTYFHVTLTKAVPDVIYHSINYED